MPEDLKLSQIGSSQLPPPFSGLHSPGVHCQNTVKLSLLVVSGNRALRAGLSTAVMRFLWMLLFPSIVVQTKCDAEQVDVDISI